METPEFSSALKRFQNRWRLGLLLTGIVRALLWIGVIFLSFGVLDYYAGFSDGARRVIAWSLALVAVTGAGVSLWKTFSFLNRDAAAEADRALASDRREILSALELQRESADGDNLGAWLRNRAVVNATKILGGFTAVRSMPLSQLMRRVKQASVVVALFVILAALAPTASWIIARRLLQPGADIPPYTRFTFNVGPQPAEVLYGGEILITADIGGEKISAPVRCLTRDPATGKIEEAPAFQESAERYSAKLEKVAAPLEVSFATGKARSAWMPVAVRMQPKVQEILLTVEPPAYTGLPKREFAVGSQELAAMAGSKIKAKITSNRPLGGGVLRLEATGSDVPAQEVLGERTGTHEVLFSWTTRGAARLVMEVNDVIGTASEPTQVEQKLIPDERPEVVLRQPSGDVLATPDSELPLEASANDDLGLMRVVMVRLLQGYRERSMTESIQAGGRHHEITGNLKLAPYGLVPGQTIEMTLEAGDTNPNLLGVSTSEPTRIHIIEREKYAEMLRNQSTLEDFSARYTALHEAMEEARKALEEMEKAVEEGDDAKAEEARAKAEAANKEAAKVFGQIAKDFPIFDLDQGLADASTEAMKQLFENGKQLDALKNKSADEMAEAMPQLKERLGKMQEEMAKQMEQGEKAEAAGKVMEQAGKFSELVEAQRELVKDFNRVAEQVRRGEMQAGQALKDLGEKQKEVAEEIRKLENDMGKALDELPEEFEEMKDQGYEFLELLKEADIPPVMDDASKSAAASQSKPAGEKAGEALSRMEELLKKDNGICKMCRGEGEPFPWPQDLSQTMQQLMESLIRRPGSGSGNKPGGSSGGGGGMGGRSDNGYWMKGKQPQLPMFGPSRSKYAKNSGGRGGEGGKGGKGGGNMGDAEVGDAELSSNATRKTGGEATAVDAVPEAYRDAVKRYFAPEENTATEPPAPNETK